MEVLAQHFSDWWRVYVVVAIVVLPVIIIFRRWAIPAILYAVELSIYLVIVHVLLSGVVRLAAWFKDQSTMKRARGLTEQNFDPGWSTPVPDFWNLDAYNPHWLVFFELALAAGIVFLMWKYRPMQVQRAKKKPAPPKAKTAAGYASRGKTGGPK